MIVVNFLGEGNTPDAREAQQFVGSEIEVVSDHEVRGYSKKCVADGIMEVPTPFIFQLVFNKPISSFTSFKNGQLFASQKVQVDDGKKTRRFALFHRYRSW